MNTLMVLKEEKYSEKKTILLPNKFIECSNEAKQNIAHVHSIMDT
jgi:hypothetical protein